MQNIRNSEYSRYDSTRTGARFVVYFPMYHQPRDAQKNQTVMNLFQVTLRALAHVCFGNDNMVYSIILMLSLTLALALALVFAHAWCVLRLIRTRLWAENAGLNPTLAVEFQRNKTFLRRSLVIIQYCGEPPESVTGR